MHPRKFSLFFANIQLKSLIVLMLTVILLALITMNILFYAVSSKALEEQSGTYFSSISTQIEQNIRTNNAFVENAIQNICNTRQLQAYLQNGGDRKTHKTFVDSLLNVVALNGCIETIKILSAETTISAAEQEPVAMFLLTQQYDLLHVQPEKPFFTLPRLSSEREASYYAYVYPIRSVELDTFREYIGTALVLINLDSILEKQDSSHFIRSTACLVMDEQDTLLSSTGGVDADAFTEACHQKGHPLSASISSVRYKGIPYYYTVASLSDVKWKILTAVPQKALSAQMDNIRLFTVLLSVCSGLLILLMAFLLIRGIYHPIRSMAEDMSKVSLGDRGLRIRSLSRNELGTLAGHINTMLDELNESARQILTTQNHLYELELTEKKSQMLALQSQINPHFLYNTLECIQSIALEHHVQQVATITSSMAKIFRYAIGESGTAALEEELACVKHYLTIMRIRFESEVLLELDIPADILPLPILRMTLQPIVENAFTHGLEKSGGEGIIRITARKQEQTLTVSVYNSGGSLTPEEAERMNRTLREKTGSSPDAHINGGVALVNIHRRLQLYGVPESGIYVSVTQERLTCFTLVFPSL